MGVIILEEKRDLDPGSDRYGNHSHIGGGDLGSPTSKMSETS